MDLLWIACAIGFFLISAGCIRAAGNLHQED